MASVIKNTEEIREILGEACARRELLVLDTPYLRFESNFLALQGGELQVQATMSREDAVYGLRTSDLKIRFPHGLGFYEAPVKMLGLDMIEGRRTLRLSVPRQILENDQRGAYRAERVGRVTTTFSTPKAQLLTAGLVDLSTTGARLLAQRDLSVEHLMVEDRITVSIPLSEEIQVHSEAIVRHLDTRRMGIEFVPPLPRSVQEPLSRWVFMRREEEQERLARRLEMKGPRATSPESALPPQGILLVSDDPGLEEALREPLRVLRSIFRVQPTIQSMKDALTSKPSLVIFHIRDLSLDQRKRSRTLVELAAGKAPVLILGTEVDGSTLFELSSAWKAASAMAWSPQRGPFLERLAQGIIRRHSSGGESPIAPREH
ncbi:PilZ domain-containing protein [Holophaga foetida]|uniref:PilZ domain-containing protein n=1 Tax=Holophaga foetida TaxID=35839 RepID=UPI0002472A79|nr:PilZ domain-containing protein [Holophaga foetida]